MFWMRWESLEYNLSPPIVRLRWSVAGYKRKRESFVEGDGIICISEKETHIYQDIPSLGLTEECFSFQTCLS